MNELLQIKQDIDIMGVIKDTFVLPAEVEEYLTGAGGPPPLKPLRPYWDKIRHPWNAHLAACFADHIGQIKPEFLENLTEISDYFIQRLDSLRKIIASHTPQNEEESAEDISDRVSALQQETLRRKRVRGRQSTVSRFTFLKQLGDFNRLPLQLFNARLMICEAGAQGSNNEAWQTLHLMVDTLGIDGNSSDETDDEDYTVRTKDWRSADVKTLLEYIDHNRKTSNAHGNTLPGNRPRRRVRRRHPPPSTHEPVAALPLNFYDQTWYDSLTEIQQVQLGAMDTIDLPVVEP